MFLIGTLSPLALLPQIFQVFVHQNVAGLSIWTWILLGTINFLWSVYGALHREYPVLVANLGMTILDLSLVLGILLFR